MEKLQEFKDEFSGRQGVHFNNAGRSPLPRTATDRLIQFVSDNQRWGALKDHDLFESLVRARKNLAKFLDAEPEQIAFTPNTATGLSQAALGFPLTESDSVVLLDQEYASNFYPWKVACERSGAKLTVISSGEKGSEEFASGDLLTEKILGAIHPGVKIVAVSWVQFQTGAILDLNRIGHQAHAVGAFFVVDGIQGLGQLPFSFKNLPVDFLASGSHKWMCGMVGQGFLAAKRNFLDRLSPTVIGCGTFNRFGTDADLNSTMENTARKFEPGALAFAPLIALDAAVEVLGRVGVSAIHEEILRLSQIFRRGLIEFGAGTIPGFQLVTPLNQPNGITSFLLPASIEEKLIQLTKEANIAIIKRGNFIRVSIHAFCNESEVDHLLALIKMSLIQSSPQ